MRCAAQPPPARACGAPRWWKCAWWRECRRAPAAARCCPAATLTPQRRAPQERLFCSLLRQDTAFFDAVSSGELASRLTSDVQVLSVSLTTNLNLIMQNGVNLLASVAVMLSVAPLMTLGFVFASALFFGLSKRLGAITRVMQKEIQDATSVANGGATQAISLLRTVRSLGAEAHEMARYAAQVADLRRKQEKIKAVWAIYMPLVSILNNGLLCAVLLADNIMTYITSMIAMLMSGMCVLGVIGRFWLRLNRTGAVAALVVAPAVSLLLFNQPTWLAFWGNPVIPAVLSSAAAAVIGSLLTQAPTVSRAQALALLNQQRAAMEGQITPAPAADDDATLSPSSSEVRG